MSDVHVVQEYMVAVGPLGNRIFLGARGEYARDVVAIVSANPGMVPLHLGVALDPLPAGLWVASHAVDLDGRGRVDVGRVATRRVVLADFARFGLPTPLPRVEEGMAP